MIVSPSIFRDRDSFVLGHYKYYWWAWLAAWWHITNNPHARAMIYKKPE